jgi:hypothetical protein
MRLCVLEVLSFALLRHGRCLRLWFSCLVFGGFVRQQKALSEAAATVEPTRDHVLTSIGQCCAETWRAVTRGAVLFCCMAYCAHT